MNMMLNTHVGDARIPMNAMGADPIVWSNGKFIYYEDAEMMLIIS